METFNITVDGEVKKYDEGTTLEEIAKDYQKNYPHQIVLAYRDGKLCELFKKVTSNHEIEFVTVAQSPGIDAYKRSATLIMLKAFYDTVGTKNINSIKVEFSVSKGYYCRVSDNIEITQVPPWEHGQKPPVCH